MKKIPTILFVILATTAYSKDSKSNKGIQPQRTVIAGHIRNILATDNHVITVNYTDPIFEAKIAQRLDEKGFFHTASDICFTQSITLYFGGKFINVLVSPSDSIFIDIDMNLYRKGSYEGITFSGKSSHAKFNKQFNPFYEYTCNNLLDTHINYSLPASAFMKQFRYHLNEQYKKLDEYARTHHILPELTKWVKHDLIYSDAVSLIEYSSDNPKQKLQVYNDEIFDSNNSKNFSTMMFSNYLGSLRYTTLKADSLFRTYLKGKDIDKECKRGVEVLMQRPASTCRDYMIYKFLKEISIENPAILSAVSKDYFTDPLFAKRLASNQKQKSYPILSGQGILYLQQNMQSQEITAKDFMKYLTEKYPDKVLYIDIWATWCGPCKAEMKYSKGLKDLLKDKDVVFVYLCLNSSNNKWMPAIKQYDVTGEHYFFDADASQLFLSAYQLLGFPSYILVNKKGEIVTTLASRPSDTEKTAATIEALLK